MERLRTERPKGLNRAGLRKWGMLFVTLGVFGRVIIQNHYLGLNGMTSQQLLDAMSGSSEVMTAVTVALILQFVEVCAVPIFCLLLVEGIVNTAGAEKYLVRVFGLAAISEIPYNFAMSSNFLDTGSRNPVFGLVLALILLYLYKRFAEKKALYLLYRVAFTVAAFFWIAVLKIDNGLPIMIVSLTFWVFRRKPIIRNLAAAGASMLCSLYSIFFTASPMSMLVLHFYNGKKEDKENRLVNYLFYPAVLVLFGLAGMLAF